MKFVNEEEIFSYSVIINLKKKTIYIYILSKCGLFFFLLLLCIQTRK
jgi:hypothetical protein